MARRPPRPKVSTPLGAKVFVQGNGVNGALQFGYSVKTANQLNGAFAQQLAPDCLANVVPTAVAGMSQDVTLTNIHVTDTLKPIMVTYDLAIGAGGRGTQANPIATDATAAVISYRTATAGRAFRGRSFIMGLPTGSVQDDLLSTAEITALQRLVTAILGVNTRVTGAQIAVISQVLGIVTPVLTALLRTIVGTMRRRVFGHK